MDKAAKLGEQVIFAIGNAPTALVRLYELIKEEKIAPELVIAVPVGYAGVFEIHDTTWKAMKASIIHKIAAIVGNLSLVIGILYLIVSFTGTGW